MLGIRPYFETTPNLDGRDGNCTRLPHFTSKEIPWYPFLLEAEWTPKAIECVQKGHLIISKDPTGNRNRNLPSCGVVPPHPHVIEIFLLSI